MFSGALSTMVSTIQTGLAAVGKKLSDYTSASAIGNILAATASVADELNTSISVAQQQAYLATATGTDLDNKAADYGIYRKQATNARWTFVATRQTAATQQYTIPAGALITTVPSAGSSPITFTVDQLTYFPIGGTSVSIPVTCTGAGTIGNISTGMALLWGSSVPGVDGVQFADSSTGTKGIDQETDDELRARAMAAFKGLAIGTDTWYIQQAKTIQGITSASVESNYISPNGIAVYIAGEGNTLPTPEQITAVQTLLDGSRPQLDKPTALAPNVLTVDIAFNITVIAGNDQATAKANAENAAAALINALGLGAQSNNNYMYPSQIVKAATAITGIADAGSVTLNGGIASIPVNLSQLPQAGAVTATVISV
ncbi:baseplate J/gp47 family protein [Desulfosporosinus sp. FKA]|uniref:baseplate J/gp47 family protein n=1 Tax=Desulfosporosinus sp. FKA TaxID=1969834 RepID=UPI000B49F135|nr:baseplate J/gp47 family protein [Desulfosporosinus sp. FKA]